MQPSESNTELVSTASADREDMENVKGKQDADSTSTDKAESTAPLSPQKKKVEAAKKTKEEPSPVSTPNEVKSGENQPGGTEKASVEACSKSEPKAFVVEAHHETEEVIERLLDVKSLNQSMTGLWGWMSGGVSKVAETASQVAEKASQQATIVAEKATQQATIVAEKASQQANIVAEKASQQAQIMAEKAAMAKTLAAQQATELAATVSKTMEDKSTSETVVSKPPAVIPAASLPWETAHPERRAEARERVLKLSMDDQTFTVPPPKEANFAYDAPAREPYAARMLDTDALLSAKRFKLVPKVVDEHDFWRNYFYRVDLILNALGVPAPVQDESEQASAKKDGNKELMASSEPVNPPDWEEEMRKEIAAAEASHVEDAGKEDENFDMLEDDLEFDDDGELEKSLNDLKL